MSGLKLASPCSWFHAGCVLCCAGQDPLLVDVLRDAPSGKPAEPSSVAPADASSGDPAGCIDTGANQ